MVSVTNCRYDFKDCFTTWIEIDEYPIRIRTEAVSILTNLSVFRYVWSLWTRWFLKGRKLKSTNWTTNCLGKWISRFQESWYFTSFQVCYVRIWRQKQCFHTFKKLSLLPTVGGISKVYHTLLRLGPRKRHAFWSKSDTFVSQNAGANWFQ